MPQFSTMTIREATKLVFPFMNDATIHQWMAQGIFRPCVYVPPPTGPGKGCQLDFFDLVTVGVLHSILSFGVKFEQVRVSGSTFPRFGLQFMEPDQKKARFRPAAELLKKSMEVGRRIQEFLDKYDGKVLVCLSPWHVSPSDRRTETQIVFFPASWEEVRERFIRDIDDDTRPTLGKVFINCEMWSQYVVQRLIAAERM